MKKEQTGTINGVDASRMVPNIRDEKGGWDLFSKLLDERIIRIDGQVDDAMASVVVSALQYLDAQEPGKEIKMYINSPGGSVIAGLAMYDAMRAIKSPVTTVVSGYAASMGSILLAGGDKRYATKNARVMIHQPSGGGRGTATDTRTNQELIEDMWDQLTQIYVDHTGVPHEVWDELLQSGDVWLNVDQAMELGLVQKVVPNEKPGPAFEGMERTKIREHFTKSVNDVLKVGRKLREEAEQKKSASNDDAPAEPSKGQMDLNPVKKL